MAQTVYILSALTDDKEWHPLAVVTSQDVANQWYAAGPNRDWVPLEVDDLSLTGLEAKNIGGNFQPTPENSPNHPMRRTLQNTTQEVQQTSEQLRELMKRLPKKRKSHFQNPLLRDD